MKTTETQQPSFNPGKFDQPKAAQGAIGDLQQGRFGSSSVDGSMLGAGHYQVTRDGRSCLRTADIYQLFRKVFY